MNMRTPAVATIGWLLMATPAAAQLQRDQTIPGSCCVGEMIQFGETASGDISQVAQGFTAGIDGPLARLDFSSFDGPSCTDDLVLTVLNPSGWTVLAQERIPAEHFQVSQDNVCFDPPIYEVFPFFFSEPASFAAGERFAIAMSSPGSCSLLTADPEDDYPGGEGFVRRTDGTWVPLTAATPFTMAADIHEFILSTYVGFEETPAGVKLSEPVLGQGNRFGAGVVVEDNTLLIGSTASGDCNFGNDRQQLYEFRSMPGGAWQAAGTLATRGEFGGAVYGESPLALHGETVLTGIRRLEFCEGLCDEEGAAGIHRRGSDGSWVQEALLRAPDGEAFDFGSGGTLSGDTAAVVGFESFRRIDGGTWIYVYTRSASSWSQQARLELDEDLNPRALAMDGDTLLAGNTVFVRNSGTWTVQATLPTHDNAMVTSADLDGDLAILGIWTTVEPDSFEYPDPMKSAYVYRRVGDQWTREDQLLPDSTPPRENFAQSVALVRTQAVVTSASTLYVYRRRGDGNWLQRQRRAARTSQIDFSGTLVVYGDRNDSKQGAWTGAAYVVDLAGGPTVAMDVKPGNDQNPINIWARREQIPVALLTTHEADGDSSTFDARDADPFSLRFGPDRAWPSGYVYHDVDGDGDLDLRLWFANQWTGITCEDESVDMTGRTNDGAPFSTSDDIDTSPGCRWTPEEWEAWVNAR